MIDAFVKRILVAEAAGRNLAPAPFLERGCVEDQLQQADKAAAGKTEGSRHFRVAVAEDGHTPMHRTGKMPVPLHY